MDEISRPLQKNVLTKKSRAGGPVTCVSFPSTELYLTARGPYLERQQLPGNKNPETQTHLVFPQGGTIHGIRHVESSSVSLVFGGQKAAFLQNALQVDEQMQNLPVLYNRNQLPHLQLSDWILDIHCKKNEEGTISLVIGLAHHRLEVWKAVVMDDGSMVEATRYRRLVSNPVCLVTSMHMASNNSGQLVVAAGTQFNDILIWQNINLGGLLTTIVDEQVAEPHYLQGHKGVVHSVKLAEDGTSLASTSDDRSIRLWKLQDDKSWTLTWVAWGHTARVWNVAFSTVGVVSVGEDGTTRVWKDGQQIAVLHASCPCNWRVDTHDAMALVGGNDGTVSLYDLSSRVQTTDGASGRLVLDTLDIPDDRVKNTPEIEEPVEAELKAGEAMESAATESTSKLSTVNRKKRKKGKKKPSSQVLVGMKWYNETTNNLPRFLIATRAGSMMSLTVHDRKWEQLEPWWDPSLLEDHGINAEEGCCMALHQSWVAIGTTRGDIVLLNLAEKLSRTVLTTARHLKCVRRLTWLNPSTLLSFHVRSVALWTLYSGNLQGSTHITLTSDTNAVPTSSAYDADNDRLVIGDSRGNVTLFHLDRNVISAEYESSVLQPSGVIRVHQKEHVTGIIVQSNKIISVGNDGCLHTSYISGTSLHKGFSIPIGSLSGVSRVWAVRRPNGDSDYLVEGYFGNVFVVVSVFTGYEFFRVDTGGRQRNSDWFVDSLSDSLCFPRSYGLAVCVNQKDGSNQLMLQYLPPQMSKPKIHFPLTTGARLHGETIFDCCLFSVGCNNSSLVLLTGSEDCTSKVSVYSSEHTGEVIYSMPLTPQESCVRSVCASQLDKSSALLVVGGGKLVLQFFLLQSIEDFGQASPGEMNVSFLGHGRTNTKATIDHRINAVKAIPLEGDTPLHLVVAGDSDGNCQIFVVSQDVEEWRITGRVFQMSTRPILAIEVVRIQSGILILFGTTAGDIFLFGLPSSAEAVLSEMDEFSTCLTPLGQYQAHQMGTNAISVSVVSTDAFSSTKILICSGGDDQAICICEATIISGGDSLRVDGELDPRRIREASSSAIKGVQQLEGRSKDERRIVSVGYSQQIAIWRYSLQRPGELKLLDSRPVDVGDVNSLATGGDLNSDIKVVVGGSGVELFSID
jgi:WD40 repeat protein